MVSMLLSDQEGGGASAENAAGGPPTPAALPVASDPPNFAKKNLQFFANSQSAISSIAKPLIDLALEAQTPDLTPEQRSLLADLLAHRTAPGHATQIGRIDYHEASIKRAELVAKAQRAAMGRTPAKIVHFSAHRHDVTHKFMCVMFVEIGKFTTFMYEELPQSREVTSLWAFAATRPLIKEIQRHGGRVDDNMLVSAVQSLAQKARNKMEAIR